MAIMLEALANDEPPGPFQDTPEWAEARGLGVVMEFAVAFGERGVLNGSLSGAIEQDSRSISRT
jgi:hypothetical protein